jgi:methionyl-tRNA formyltransferase
MSQSSRDGAPFRIGFAGTPEFAAAILKALLAGEHQLVAVYSQPDRRAGRGRKMLPSAVKELAVEHHLDIRQPTSLRNESAVRELATFNLDVFVVAAYGLILPKPVLALPTYGCINVHASLLPRWRGAAPVERAIMAGDSHTGVSIMQMDSGLDTGPILDQARLPIDDRITGQELERQLAQLGAQRLAECLSRLESLTPQPQSEVGTCYADKLTAADAHVDWNQPAHYIQRQIRALNGRLTATARVGDLNIKLLEARWQAGSTGKAPATVVAASPAGIQVACGDGSIIVQCLQLNRGKGRPLQAADAINGYPDLFTPGASLADPH